MKKCKNAFTVVVVMLLKKIYSQKNYQKEVQNFQLILNFVLYQKFRLNKIYLFIYSFQI